MTEIDFYFHVEDKLQTACKLSAKAFGGGLRVLAWCPDEETGRKFDRLLWTTPAIGFVPHCGPDNHLAPVTPVIVDYQGTNLAHDQVLLNLRSELPEFFSRFQRLIEIVTIDEEDRRAARERYKFYRDRGYDIRTHDMSEQAQ